MKDQSEPTAAMLAVARQIRDALRKWDNDPHDVRMSLDVINEALDASPLGALHNASHAIAFGAYQTDGDKVTISKLKFDNLRRAVTAVTEGR